MGVHYVDNQILGRVKTIGCVAVEVTQKCNLDCTLCYLSENSQHVRDVPLPEVLRRLDQIVDQYGVGVPVQITGGDPTLRKHRELIQIVEHASKLGLHPSLFTNGIAASRSLLSSLAKVGLTEVAFHVDTTQRRSESGDEAELNALRGEYIERARGLGLTIMFNTTVHTGNVQSVPMLARFFANHADVVGMVSFQVQAETGRGEWQSHQGVLSRARVRQLVDEGVGVLPWDRLTIGHPDCHSYVPTLVAGGQVFPVFEDQRLVEDFMRDFSDVNMDRHDGVARIVFSGIRAVLGRPRWWARLCSLGVQYARRFGPVIVRGHRPHKLSFFVQSFMDADAIEQDRVDACSFMVMTADGPVSMCQHNAHRDDYILKSLSVRGLDGEVVEYEPLPASAREGSSQRIAAVTID